MQCFIRELPQKQYYYTNNIIITLPPKTQMQSGDKWCTYDANYTVDKIEYTGNDLKIYMTKQKLTKRRTQQFYEKQKTKKE